MRKSAPQPATIRTPMGGTVFARGAAWVSNALWVRLEGTRVAGPALLTQDGDEDDEDCADHDC